MSLIDDLVKKSPYDLRKDGDAAQRWFRDAASKLNARDIQETRLLKDSRAHYRNKPFPGHCYMFFYDPKGKATLPYYDRFPLVFPFHVDAEGFTGLNVHYLPPPLRAKLLDALQSVMTNKNYDDTTKLKLSYDALQSASKFKYFAPTVKRYLHGHLRSRLVHVDPDQWDLVVLMPLQRFVGATSQQVWKESRARI